MKDKIYRIKFDALPATKNWPVNIPDAYYGPVRGVSMNHAIYSRVERDKAHLFDKYEAVRQVQGFLGSGYGARCEPPISITY